MSRVDAAAPDRLPWLADQPQASRTERAGNAHLPWAAAAAAVVAGASFWVGTRSVDENPATQPRSTTTVRLPEPRRRIDQQATLAARGGDGQSAATAVQTHDRRVTPTRISGSPKPSVVRRPRPRRAPARAVGRVVQVGAFGSSRQANSAWTAIIRANPALGNRRALVIPARNSNGRSYYRFQIATTSQAHSEVLCQRMRKVGLSCAVSGPSRKAKGER